MEGGGVTRIDMRDDLEDDIVWDGSHGVGFWASDCGEGVRGLVDAGVEWLW